MLDPLTYISIAIIITSMVLDYRTKSEVLPIASISLSIISIVLNNAICLLISIVAIPISRSMDLIKMRKTGIEAIYHLLLDVTPITLAIIMSIVVALASGRVLFIGMDKWSSQVLFSTIILLILSSIIEPSTDFIEIFSKWLFIKTDIISNTLNVIAHVIGFIVVIAFMQLEIYGLIVLFLWIVMLLARKRVEKHLKIFIELTPYIIAFLIAYIKGV
uniref:Uncharacterized protein n=1 Tax=Ignisphaera aggregans TaxID=334771 RepID=A0A7J3QEN9_9CREN